MKICRISTKSPYDPGTPGQHSILGMQMEIWLNKDWETSPYDWAILYQGPIPYISLASFAQTRYMFLLRVATHQQVKNSLTFPWPFVNEKQSMFSFTLAFLQAINSSIFIFNLFPIFAERGRRNLEESIYNENHSDHNYYMC